MQSLGAKTILYPTPVMVVGTYDENEKPNIMTAAWGGICCSKPPCLAVSLRSATYSHAGLMARKAFTVSLPSAKQAAMADYAGLYSGRDHDKFQALGLTPVKSELVDAPYVGEFPLVVECKVLHVLEIGLHTQFVGEIMDVKIDPACLTDGKPDPAKIDPIAFMPELRTYHGLGPVVGKAFSMGKKD